MDISTILKKKMNGEELNKSEIEYFINNVCNKSINDSQIGAMLTAIYLKGLTTPEAIALTKSMLYSGDILSWDSKWDDLLVDKHSTGGIGDKISIPLAPALAACGLKVPMLSGRGLDFTGGTLDKLESIPGFKVALSKSDMRDCLENAGCFIGGATENVCPADRILYAKRNETCTIDNINLIVGSIISKKAAGGIKNLVLDIKVGRGAFMKDIEKAEALAKQLVSVSSGLGIKTKAYLTKMDHPLGRAVGNALEIIESVNLLKGEYVPHVSELVTAFGGSLLEMAGKADTFDVGEQMISAVLRNGSALECFKKMLSGQGVKEDTIARLCNGDKTETQLTLAKYQTEILATETGLIVDIDGLTIGKLSYKLSTELTDGKQIDLGVGMKLKKIVGESVTKTEPWLIVYHSKPAITDSEKKILTEAIKIKSEYKSKNIVSNLILNCIS